MTPVHDEVRRRTIYENVQLFIRSKTDILNATIFKYSLRTFGESILHRKYQEISAMKNPTIFDSLLLMYMMTQKGDPCTKVSNTLSEVTLMCFVLAQLSILCSSVIKPYFTKMAIHPLFTVHMLRQLHALSYILDLIKAEQSINQNVPYFILPSNLGPQSGQFHTLESFATKIVSSRLPRR